MKFRLVTSAFSVVLATTSAMSMDLRQAVQTAVATNPSVLESSANHRARGHELTRAQGAFLPSLSLSGDIGGQRLDRPNSFTRNNNDQWRTRKQLSVTVEQLLFDDFGSVNEIYRQAARVDGAALRALERSEAIALDATETYIDVIRHAAILAQTRRNVSKHRSILGDMRQRYEGGETGAADLSQAQERVAATELVAADVRKSLLDTLAKFERVVGEKPGKLTPANSANVPAGPVDRRVDIAAVQNPQIQAAIADADAVRQEYETTKSPFMPRVSLQGVASVGDDLDGVEGRNNEYTGKLVFSWNLFNGGKDRTRRMEYAERLTESQVRVDKIRREIKETIERSWAAVETGNDKIRAISRQVAANRKVVDGYRQEYDIGQRTLLDVLNTENALFNSKIDLISARMIYAFTTYQLRGTTSELLAYLNVEVPEEAVDGQRGNVSIFPTNASFHIEPLRKLISSACAGSG
ncbi:TolC family outer membrane protein [Breoghania sp.]|uniref:TolC family outer membrane protein n=1 Tax=Breoghania sp. TaxID=2065378 RepID=UPI0026057180|nr:TolC family outer membrane protein [Breoghania sp.]MDJ0929803.1 TolC family outer membrane protein [Breoghania sp.]